jgi:hypothetical protein
MMVCQGWILESLLKHGVLSKSTAETLEKKRAAGLDPDNSDEERISEWVRDFVSKSSRRVTMKPFAERSRELYAAVPRAVAT